MRDFSKFTGFGLDPYSFIFMLFFYVSTWFNFYAFDLLQYQNNNLIYRRRFFYF